MPAGQIDETVLFRLGAIEIVFDLYWPVQLGSGPEGIAWTMTWRTDRPPRTGVLSIQTSTSKPAASASSNASPSSRALAMAVINNCKRS